MPRSPGSSCRASADASPDHRLSLDLDVIVADQLRLDQGVGRADIAEVAAMHPRHRLPLFHIAEVDAGAHDVLEIAAERRDAGRDLVQDVDGLAARVAFADHLAAAMGGRRAAYQDAVVD